MRAPVGREADAAQEFAERVAQKYCDQDEPDLVALIADELRAGGWNQDEPEQQLTNVDIDGY